jgi:putative drug exporter of the RND superfamily
MRFARLGRFLVRRRRIVAALAVVGFLATGALGSDVADKLSTGGFEDPSADSARARDLLDEQFGAGQPNVVLLVRAVDVDVDDPAVVAAGAEVADRLAAYPGVREVVSYWSLGNAPPLRADDGSSALVLARVDGSEDEVDEQIEAIVDEFAHDDGRSGPVRVGVGGRDATFQEVGTTIERDLTRAELIAFPLTLLLLLVVFRSVVAALLPLAVGALAIVGTFFVLEVLAGFTTVSIFALNLTTAMGLGLSIDYSLFVVSRFREERAAGHGPSDAVVRTVATAGRAVFFSGLTVAASLGALLVFPIAFLRSFAYAGIPVVGLAVVGAVVVLPAVLAMLGDRLDRLSLPRRTAPVASGRFWRRTADVVMNRPIPVATAAILLLLALGAPFLHINFGLPDDRVLPESAGVRQVADEIRDHYDSNEAGAISVVLPGSRTDVDAPAIDTFAREVSSIDEVSRVDGPTGTYVDGMQVVADSPLAERFEGNGADGTWLSVVPSVEPISSEGEALVEHIRALPSPTAGDVLVGGTSAQLVDLKDSVFDRLPWAILIVVAATFALLFLMFGSLLVPAKALVLNTLSLTATFGAMVWIFQDGNLSGLLDFTATGMLDTTTPVLMFCVAFGLSMDYEVFLLSRIKEEYERTGDNRTSVAAGLARTGRIITAAALLISIVFMSFATSSVSFIKLFGVGLTLAVLMDATVVRATLVPAFMRLAGDANWWAPAPLRRVYERVGLSEGHAERVLAADAASVDDDTSEPEPELVGSSAEG